MSNLNTDQIRNEMLGLVNSISEINHEVMIRRQEIDIQKAEADLNRQKLNLLIKRYPGIATELNLASKLPSEPSSAKPMDNAALVNQPKRRGRPPKNPQA